MVTTDKNEFFEKSKIFFESNDVSNSLESYEKAISYINRKDKASYIQFLNKIIDRCRTNNLKEEEAIALRHLGRTYSVFKLYVESLKYHEQALKIQRKLGNQLDVAEGLLFLAEDLEVSGNYDGALSAYKDAAEIFRELGKLKQAKDVQKQIKRLELFTKEMVEDEYLLNRFHVDKY